MTSLEVVGHAATEGLHLASAVHQSHADSTVHAPHDEIADEERKLDERRRAARDERDGTAAAARATAAMSSAERDAPRTARQRLNMDVL